MKPNLSRNALIFHLIFSVIAALAYSFNVRLFRFINTDFGPLADILFDTATQISDGYFWFYVFAFMLIWKPEKGLAGIKLILVLSILIWAAKQMIPHPRPLTLLEDVRVIGEKLRFRSFPSGHTATIFGVAALARLWWGAKALPLYVLAALGGLSRIYVGAHFPFDVVAGAYLGTVAAYIPSAFKHGEAAAARFVAGRRKTASAIVSVVAAAVAVNMMADYSAASASPAFYNVLFAAVLLAGGIAMGTAFITGQKEE
ncbi:MAG: phosphatase PAP2 family protein [Nitrospirae bacterium]|nr:phosphatase PAP2 family protein [Nitrospirota bacterium]